MSNGHCPSVGVNSRRCLLNGLLWTMSSEHYSGSTYYVNYFDTLEHEL